MTSTNFCSVAKCVFSQRKSRCLFIFVDHGQAVVNSGRPGCFAFGLVYFMIRLVRSPAPGPKAAGSEHCDVLRCCLFKVGKWNASSVPVQNFVSKMLKSKFQQPPTYIWDEVGGRRVSWRHDVLHECW